MLIMIAAGSTVAMADLYDGCDNAFLSGGYYNLESPQADYIRWSSPPDDSYLIQSSNHREASALYQCPGAEKAVIAIYSRHGSFASWDGDRLIRGGEELPLFYHPASDEVYCQGQKMVYSAISSEFLFSDGDEPPSGLVPYGLSVQVSIDGQDFFPASCDLRSARREGPYSYWYEVYEVELENEVRFIKVLLTDQASIQIQGREDRYSFEMAGGLALASVEITGAEEGSWEDDNHWDDPIEEEDWSDWENTSFEREEHSEDYFIFLPEYRPETEEDWETPSWGPDPDLESGSAFPEELLQPEEPEEEKEPLSLASSKSISKAEKESPSQKKTTEVRSREDPKKEAEEIGIIPVRLSDSQRISSVPLWRRALEPDIVSMLLISASLLIAAFRILWEREQERKEDRRQN